MLCVSGRSLMVKKNDGIKESTDSSNTIEDDGKLLMVSTGQCWSSVQLTSTSCFLTQHFVNTVYVVVHNSLVLV